MVILAVALQETAELTQKVGLGEGLFLYVGKVKDCRLGESEIQTVGVSLVGPIDHLLLSNAFCGTALVADMQPYLNSPNIMAALPELQYPQEPFNLLMIRILESGKTTTMCHSLTRWRSGHFSFVCRLCWCLRLACWVIGFTCRPLYC